MLITKFHLRLSTNYYDTTDRDPKDVSEEAMGWECEVMPNLGDQVTDLEALNHQLIGCIEAYRGSMTHTKPDAPLYVGIWFESNAEDGEFEIIFEPDERPHLTVIQGGKDD